MEKILLAGGTGFIGTALAKHLVNAGYFVNILTKNPANKHPKHSNINYFEWNIENNFLDKTVFSDVKTLINLTGVGISDKRWSKKRKTEIIESRIKAIDLLYNTVVKENISLNQFISSSAVGYYGAVTSPYIFTEESQNGSDFLAFVCKEWENAALQFEKIGVPTGILRKGVVIGKHGGLYKKLTPLARMGINTALGTGEQFLPWIDIRDLVRLYRAILEKKITS